MGPRFLRRNVFALLALAIVLLLVAPVANAASSSSSSSGSHLADNSTTTNSSTITASFCERCRDFGECEHAYRGGPGVFCKAPTTLRRPVCCCALRDPCGSRHCDCAVVPRPHPTTKAPRIGAFSSNKIGWTVVAMLVLGVLFAVYMYTTRLDRKYHYRDPTPPTPAYRPPPSPAPATLPPPHNTETKSLSPS